MQSKHFGGNPFAPEDDQHSFLMASPQGKDFLGAPTSPSHPTLSQRHPSFSPPPVGGSSLHSARGTQQHQSLPPPPPASRKPHPLCPAVLPQPPARLSACTAGPLSSSQPCQNSWSKTGQVASCFCRKPSEPPTLPRSQRPDKGLSCPSPSCVPQTYQARFYPRALALAVRAVKKGGKPWGKKKLEAPQQRQSC